MSKVNVELNRDSVRQMLKSPEMKALLQERAQEVVLKLGEGYESTSHTGTNRANASILATTYRAWQENLKENKVLKALR